MRNFAESCMIDPQIYNLETQYIEQANPRGNALKGQLAYQGCFILKFESVTIPRTSVI